MRLRSRVKLGGALRLRLRPVLLLRLSLRPGLLLRLRTRLHLRSRVVGRDRLDARLRFRPGLRLRQSLRAVLLLHGRLLGLLHCALLMRLLYAAESVLRLVYRSSRDAGVFVLPLVGLHGVLRPIDGLRGRHSPVSCRGRAAVEAAAGRKSAARVHWIRGLDVFRCKGP